MANTKLIFCGTEESNTHNDELQVYCNYRKELFIQIEPEDYSPLCICLDKPTAIKLSKEIRRQIALMSEE